MNCSERAFNVLRWMDYATPAKEEFWRKSCRGQRDVERMRASLRRSNWPEPNVALMTEAAQKRDVDFLVRYAWIVGGGA